MLKWFEIFSLLILAQYHSDKVNWKRIVPLLVGSGVLLSLSAIFQLIRTDGWSRPSIFWQNPNALAIFLCLPTLFCLLYGSIYIQRDIVKGISLFFAGVLMVIGIGSTGSRTGFIVLFTGALVLIAFYYKQIPIRHLLGAMSASITLSTILLIVADRTNFVLRFLPEISTSAGSLTIQPPPGIVGRYQLIQKGIDLWIQQPVFGYGWFASPENPNVGFLDLFYVQILVDLGIIGFILVMLFYANFIREFLHQAHASPEAVSVVGAGWLIGIMAGGIGEAWPRVPRLMFLLILLLITSKNANSVHY
jgi:O-antigen ligase